MRKIIFSLLMLSLCSCGEEENAKRGVAGRDLRAQGVDSIDTGKSLFFECKEPLTGITVNLDASWSNQSFFWFVDYEEKTAKGKTIVAVQNIVGQKHSRWARIVLFKGATEIGYLKEVDFDIAELVVGDRKFDCLF
jgi:hypothetical protein